MSGTGEETSERSRERVGETGFRWGQHGKPFLKVQACSWSASGSSLPSSCRALSLGLASSTASEEENKMWGEKGKLVFCLTILLNGTMHFFFSSHYLKDCDNVVINIPVIQFPIPEAFIGDCLTIQKEVKDNCHWVESTVL